MNPRHPLSGISAREGFSRKREDELLAAAARIFRTEFPNPERSGCPSQEVLRAVTHKRRDAVESEVVLEHLTCCSPCFKEYESLLRREKISKNLKVLALCASLIITVAVAFWFYSQRGQEGLRQPEPTIVKQPPAPQPPPPIRYEVAVVDLRNRAPVRGEQQPTPSDPVVASLPAKPLELSVYLPIGSEEGRYELQILRRADTPLISLAGSAVLENRNMILRLRADLAGLDPGQYLVGIRKGDFRWSYYPIALTN